MSIDPPAGIALGVGLIALAALLFEVLLTRIFAVTLWYHFGFLAISLALLGTATGAVLCYAFPERLIGERYRENLVAFAVAFAIVVPITVLVHLHIAMPVQFMVVKFYAAFGVQLLLLFVSFLLAGLCISIALFRFAKRINTIYSYDLIGAAIGSVLVVPLLYRVSGPAAVFVVSAAAFLSAASFARSLGNRRLLGLLLGAAVVAIGLSAANDRLDLLHIVRVKSYTAGHLQERERSKVFEKWSPISRVVVHRQEMMRGQPVMRLTADAGAPTHLHRFNDHNFARLTWLDNDSREAVHFVKSNGKVLVIGSGGGADVLAALRFGQRQVTAVELNPVTVDIVSRQFADYIGNIFNDPRVTLHMQEGRNFTAGSRDHYDVIQITMIDSWAGAAAGAYIFNENSLYTVEAVRDYWTHLEPDGVLSITRYIDFDEALRLTNMMVEAARAEGVTDVASHMAVLSETHAHNVWPRTTVLLKKGTFAAAEAERLRQLATRSNAVIIHLPGVPPAALDQSVPAADIREVIAMPLVGKARTAALARHNADVSAPTDDRPFFFFTSRLRDVFNPDPAAHPARRMAMPLLYGMLVAFTLIGILTVFVPLYLRSGAALRDTPDRVPTLTYFALLGLGYLLVEISLIQRLTVFLGHPTWSFVAVLSTMLCASGIGSRLSERLPQNARALTLVLGATAVLIVIYVGVVYDQFIHLMWLGRPVRVLLAVVVCAIPALLMGMCFPLGMQLAQRKNAALVPWGWGVNGAFSVLAPILAIALSLNFGLKITLIAGGLCYAVAMVIVRTYLRRAEETVGARSAELAAVA